MLHYNSIGKFFKISLRLISFSPWLLFCTLVVWNWKWGLSSFRNIGDFIAAFPFSANLVMPMLTPRELVLLTNLLSYYSRLK